MYMSVISAFQELKKYGVFEANLGYIMRPGFKNLERNQAWWHMPLVPTLKRQTVVSVLLCVLWYYACSVPWEVSKARAWRLTQRQRDRDTGHP